MVSFQGKFNTQTIISVAISAALIFLLVSRDPFESGPTIVLVFLCLLFVLIFNLTYRLNKCVRTSERFKISPSRVASYYSSILVATGVIFLVGLQTIGQLQVTDILLVVCFETLANFYILRRL